MMGKGSDCLIYVILPCESLKCYEIPYKEEIWNDTGVHPNNQYTFASTQNSGHHIRGWIVCLKGALNATKNGHWVTSLLAKLKLSRKEKDLIYKNFAHSEKINQNFYQASAGS